MAEEKFKVSERSDRTFIEESPILTLIIGEDGTIKDVNNAVLACLGYAKDELVGKRALDYVVPEQRRSVAEQIENDSHEKERLEKVWAVKAKDGSIHKLMVRIAHKKIRDRDYPNGTLITGIDITRKIQAEEGRRESKRNLEYLFNSLQDFLFILDDQGHILFANHAAQKSLGYATKEIIGKDLVTICLPSRREEARTFIAEARSRGFDTCSIPLLAVNGDLIPLIPVETKITYVKWGGKDALFCIAREITTKTHIRKQLEKTRNELELRVYKRTIELSNAIIETNHEIYKHKQTEAHLRTPAHFRRPARPHRPLLSAGEDQTVGAEQTRKVGATQIPTKRGDPACWRSD